MIWVFAGLAALFMLEGLAIALAPSRFGTGKLRQLSLGRRRLLGLAMAGAGSVLLHEIATRAGWI
ncbi:hypothetical protein [Neotabrizicola sp. VNH66]|uniref:hypothetical protein n=1 Tax=Neotabrizicola sp. VNH66 TaxID=3400918 RepID=UPI003C024166